MRHSSAMTTLISTRTARGATLKSSESDPANIDPMLDQWWARVVDGGSTLIQHWVNVSCLLGTSKVDPRTVDR